MPGFGGGGGGSIAAVGFRLPAAVMGLPSPPLAQRNVTISGVTVDVSAAPLGSCVVKLFETATDLLVQQVTSNATTGAYSFTVDPNKTYYTVQYKAGSSDVYGSSLNTLAGA